MTASTFDQRLAEFDQDQERMPRRTRVTRRSELLYQCSKCSGWYPRDGFPPLANPASLCGISSWCRACDNQGRSRRRRKATAKAKPIPPGALERAMAHIREHFLDGTCTRSLPGMAGLTTTAFCAAFRARFGKTAATARAELQIAEAKTLMRQGMRIRDITSSTGFSSHQRMANAFREVTGQNPTEWLAQEREKNPTIPAQPKRPGRPPGTPNSPERNASIAAGVAANWKQRAAIVSPRTPPSKGPQPYVPPKAREAAEIKRQAAAFDEHQRRMAAERDVATGGFVAKETRPSRERGEAAPIDPQHIPIVDNTPTAFDRFARDGVSSD